MVLRCLVPLFRLPSVESGTHLESHRVYLIYLLFSVLEGLRTLHRPFLEKTKIHPWSGLDSWERRIYFVSLMMTYFLSGSANKTLVREQRSL